MKLTAANVEKIFLHCLYGDGPGPGEPVIVKGIVCDFGFHRGRLDGLKADIKKMLDQLPSIFQISGGGGGSFLNACMTEDNEQWGEHRSIEQLLALGIATGQAKIQFPRSLWPALPGGMPYFVVGPEEVLSK
jgi:hypothetical protein